MGRIKIALCAIGCIALLFLVVLGNFLVTVQEKQELWTDCLRNKEYKEILVEADKFRERYDYRIFIPMNIALIHEEMARLDQLEGQAAYARGDLVLAKKIYQRKNYMKDPELLSRFFYNQGMVSIVEKKYAVAIEDFKNALHHDPNNIEAAYNLEILVMYWYYAPGDSGSEDVGESGLNSFDVTDLHPWSEDKSKETKEEELRY